MTELPIIVLAFANDREGQGYLRDLSKECNALQKIYEEAERNGLCRLVFRTNAEPDDIGDVIRENLNHIVIFHYGGHASGEGLKLESDDKGGATAHAGGLAALLGLCTELQLVFLNGGSTHDQGALLRAAGAPSVIVTARSIADDVARQFAVNFHQSLVGGIKLRQAYDLARNNLRKDLGDAPRPYYRELGDTSGAEPRDELGLPWELEFKDDKKTVKDWTLADAANKPDFGLPPLPDRDLPVSPFRQLDWFTADQAEVFFGRGRLIRDLYEQIVDPKESPIIFLYGAAGVGKSSVLDAGLMPRLQAGGCEVEYCRRDQQKGLSGSLRAIMKSAGDTAQLNEDWRAEEKRLNKPLIYIVDQIEEVFTRPDTAQARELKTFVDDLKAAVGNVEARPRGKFVLGFRKEWLAELRDRLDEAKLPHNDTLLKPLDRPGILEAITGPARPGRLQRRYRLEIVEGLPEMIADDLLRDAGATVAPTLQVLLTKMWEHALQTRDYKDGKPPRFDNALYQTAKSEGYLLQDVLNDGVKAIGHWNPAVEQSGLALDVLAYHTTEFGTAAQRSWDELKTRYAHQADKLEGLLDQCKGHYLVIEVEKDDSPTRPTRLAHDLLAPIVQQRFRISMAPGQRARRLLENRAPEWRDGKTGALLDETDLTTVEAGASGMRASGMRIEAILERSGWSRQAVKSMFDAGLLVKS